MSGHKLSAVAASSSNDDGEARVLIAGAGMMGTATAYYLAKNHGVASTIIDPTGRIAPAASGKAGGFLALDWNDHDPAVGRLTRRSFELHQELADTLGAETIDYRRLTCAMIQVMDQQSPSSAKKLTGVEWAKGDSIVGMRSLGDESTIAQVHPHKLCHKLFEETQELTDSGTSLVTGRVTGAVYLQKDGQEVDVNDAQQPPSDARLIGARLDDGTIVEGTSLLYACGPWTSNLMTGTKYHSVVMPTDGVQSQCVFFSGCGDPEVYVRPDATAYCTGFPDSACRVTERPGDEEVRDGAVARIEESVQKAAALTSSGVKTSDEGTGVIKQACYLPSAPDGRPMMGELPNMPGCYVCTGHTCWGILLGPASGEIMANMIGGDGTSAAREFAPGRFGNGMKMVP